MRRSAEILYVVVFCVQWIQHIVFTKNERQVYSFFFRRQSLPESFFQVACKQRVTKFGFLGKLSFSLLVDIAQAFLYKKVWEIFK